MTTRAAKAIVGFLLLMLAFTFLSWKLDVLRTPQVCFVEAEPGMVDGKYYDLVVPSEAVTPDASPEKGYVYILADSTSYFYPQVVRQVSVRILAQGEGRTAIEGIYQTPLVRYADRSLSGSTIPVRILEEEAS